MRHIFFILLLPISFILTSCFEEDNRITPKPRNEVEISNSIYEKQTWFDIENQEVVQSNDIIDWDLGFESSEFGWHIILNSSRFMYAAKTQTTDFESIKNADDYEMIFDDSDGDLDSTAIGKWADFSDFENPVYYKNVYIINRGKNEKGENYGFKKIIFEKLNKNIYYIRYANLDGTDEKTFYVPKYNNVNFTLFCFDEGNELSVQEPEINNWDIIFTKYSTILYEGGVIPTPYLVRGVLANKNVSVAIDSINPFYQITYQNINDYRFSDSRDALGYDWKVYTDDGYKIREGLTYIIRNRNNKYYKLRFTSFHNNSGERGFPRFELNQLKD